MINVSSPSVIKIIFELPLVKEIVALSAKALELSSFVNLAIPTFQIVLGNSQVIVNRSCGIPDNVLGIENSKLLPLFEGALKMCWVLEHINFVVVRWLLFELIHQLLGQIWVLRSCLYWFNFWVHWDGFPVRWRLGERLPSSYWALVCLLRAWSLHVVVSCLWFCAPSFCRHGLRRLRWRIIFLQNGVIGEASRHFDRLTGWRHLWWWNISWRGLRWCNFLTHKIIFHRSRLWIGLFGEIKVSCLLFPHHIIWAPIVGWSLVLSHRLSVGFLPWSKSCNFISLLILQFGQLFGL